MKEAICKSLEKLDEEQIQALMILLQGISGVQHQSLRAYEKDEPGPYVSKVIAELKSWDRLMIIMLTGDHESSGWRVANDVDIEKVYCNLKPADKLNHVKNISRDSCDGFS